LDFIGLDLIGLDWLGKISFVECPQDNKYYNVRLPRKTRLERVMCDGSGRKGNAVSSSQSTLFCVVVGLSLSLPPSYIRY